MSSGQFRMDAHEALQGIQLFESTWTADVAGITNEDRRVAAAALDLAAAKCTSAAKRLRGKMMRSTVMVEAQDLELGYRVALDNDTDAEVTGLVVHRGFGEVSVVLDGQARTVGLRDTFRVLVES